MIKLKNVSKFYYNKGVIASGFTKVNLELKMGEFVAITGESGSGKSTLLNVISGLDTYEEGEMYINGEETSHYTEKDLEDYRRTYIGNIFQSFNLVNSYTVYQNIELILLLNGEKKKDIKPRVNRLIRKVGLEKFKNVKVSKLSGGQKQRVAIARALAKDTPIIIADEPTGNLDEKSANEVMKLLSDVAKDKLVIVVTHNYEQVEKYVTRKIKMHDGKIIENSVIKPTDEVENSVVHSFKNITYLNKVRLGIRNTFNIVPKFLLIFAVFLFVTSALLSEYASYKKNEKITGELGENYIFYDVSKNRIVVKKANGEAFSDEDFDRIGNIPNVKKIEKNDLLVDKLIFVEFGMFQSGAFVSNLKSFEGNLDLGEMPKDDYEIILEGVKDTSMYYEGVSDKLNVEAYITNSWGSDRILDDKLKVVGIKYVDEDQYNNDRIYVSDKVFKNIEIIANNENTKTKILYKDRYYSYKLKPNDNVPEGKAYVNSYFDETSDEGPVGKNIEVSVENIYYKENVTLKIDKLFTKSNFESLLGLKNYESQNETIFINTADYNKLFSENTYQSSVYVEDSRDTEKVAKSLQDMGFRTLVIKDTLVKPTEEVAVMKIFKTIVTVLVVIALIFISYFVIKIILKSRNVYFSTIRMLGASSKICKNLLVIELFTVSNLAFWCFVVLILLTKNNIISFEYVKNLITYLSLGDYAILYVILMFMSYVVSLKFANSLFKKSAMNAYKEEV